MRHTKIAAPHNDRAGVLRNSLKKQRDVFRVVLPVGIKRNHVGSTQPCGRGSTSQQSGPLAAVTRQAH